MTDVQYQEEFEDVIRDYIKVIWNGKWLLLGLMVLAVLSAGIYSEFMTTPGYQASSTLLIFPPEYIAYPEISTLSRDVYQELAMTDDMKASIIKELDLRNDQGEPFLPSALNGMMNIKVREVNEDNKQDNAQQALLIILSVRGSDPEECSRIANAWAELLKETSREIRQGDAKQTSTVVRGRFEEAKIKLRQAEEELNDFRQQTRLNLARNELFVKQSKLTEFTEELIEMQTTLGSEEANYQYLKDTISEMKQAGKWKGDNGVISDNDLLQSQLKMEYLKKQIAFHRRNRESLKEEVQTLQDQVWQAQMKEDELLRKVEDVKIAYNMLFDRVEEVKALEAQNKREFIFVTQAIPPSSPLGNDPIRNAALAAIIAPILGLFILFFREFMREGG